MVYSIIQKSQLESAQRLDAEYFMPEYQELEKRLLTTNSYKEWGKLDGEFITGPFGSEFNVENYSETAEYRYVRGKDVKQFFLLDDDNVYIPEKDYERMQKYSLQNGDILISVVGTLGNSAIVSDKNLPAIFSCKSTLFRTDKLNPYYLIAYLNSKYGQNLLLRNARGQVQTGLNISDLKTLLIFTPSAEDQTNIASMVKGSSKLIDESKQFYSLAENLLLEELGLKDFQLKDNLSFVVNLSDVKAACRADAEYFQPKYELLVNKFKLKKKLSEFVGRVKTSFKIKLDKQYNYIEIGDVNAGFGEVSFNKVLGKELPANAKIKVGGGELIVSKVRPTRGAIAIIPDEFGEDFVVSGAFSVFNVNSPTKEYLQIVLRSIIGKIQLEKPATGTSYPTVTDEDVEELWIPDLSKLIQHKIADLVKQSHEARQKSKELLEQAKRAVEEMIDNMATRGKYLT